MNLVDVCGAGDASRRAASVLDEDAAAISRAIRRALPFVARRGLAVTTQRFSVATASQAIAALDGPVHSLVLKCASGARGIVAFDGKALALMIDGVLGGDGSAVPVLRADGLTPPQAALAARMTDAVSRAVAERINARFSLGLKPDAADRGASEANAAFLIARIEVGAGVILLALPRTLSVARVTEFRSDDPTLAAIIADVDIELTIDLGTMSVPLAKLVSLKAGDTILSDIPTTSEVTVRADGRALFEGRPTNVGGRFAVRIERKG